MNEEAVNLIFDWVKGRGYQGSKEEWLNYIYANDDAFNYIYDIAKQRGYQKDQNSFGTLIGKTTPVATTAPAKTEPAKTEPAKTEVAIATPVAETKPTVTPEPEKMQVKSVEPTPTKEEPMTAEKKEAVKSDIESQLLPVTEKTEVKAIETPSDKMVIKSEAKVEPAKPVEEVKVEETKVEQPKVEVKPTEEAKVEVKEMKTEEPKMKVKGKLKTEPIKIETIKVESEKGPTTVEVPSFSVPEPRKKYKPYGEEGPDIYYSEENDQYIIKEGDNRTVAEKGSEKYNDIEKRLNTITLNTMFGQGKCPDRVGGCAKNIDQVREYFYAKKQKDGESGLYDRKIIDQEGNLADNIDGYYYAMVEGEDGKPRVERLKQDSLAERYESENHEELNMKDYYIAEKPPKSERFSIYKPFGDKSISLIYDNNTGVIMKETDDKIMSKDGKPMTTWKDVPMYKSEYKELKSIIEGINYKKEKESKNTFIVPSTETQFVPDWLKK
jgi:hypothetical protein